MTRADHAYDCNLMNFMNDKGELDYQKLSEIYHEEFEIYQREKESIIDALQNRLESQIENHVAERTARIEAERKLSSIGELLKLSANVESEEIRKLELKIKVLEARLEKCKGQRNKLLLNKSKYIELDEILLEELNSELEQITEESCK